MALINKDQKYKWEFCNIGGTSRVKISSGKDIANLYQLDTKMWTVLSCPVKGLEIDEKSLNYMDCDADGKIRVNDVICVSKWITGALNDPDLLLQGKDSAHLNDFNQENEAGSKLYKSAKQILENLGKAAIDFKMVGDYIVSGVKGNKVKISSMPVALPDGKEYEYPVFIDVE